MKKILKEWKRFITETYNKNIDMELDSSTDSIILYHTGWMHPSDAFKNSADLAFTGEPEIIRGMDRPMGNNAIYFSTNKSTATGYKRFSELPYLYKVRFPISKIAGGNPNDPMGIIGRNEITLPKEQAEYFFEKAAKNLSTDYKARFQVVNTGLEVGVYDASLVEVVEWNRLFTDGDVRKWFDKTIRPSLDDYLSTKKLPDGKYEVYNSAAEESEIFDKDELIEYLEGDIEDMLDAKDISPKKKTAMQEFKRIFPNEFKNYKTSLLKVLEMLKQENKL